MWRKINVLVLILSFSILLLNPISSLAQEKDVIRIGLVTTLSGPFAQPGSDMLEGAKLYLEEAGYKMAGKKVEFFVEDDEANPSVTLSKVKKLVEMNRIQVLIGPMVTSCGYAVQPYVDSQKLPSVPITSADDLTQRIRAKYMLRITCTVSQISHPLGEYAYKNLGYRKITCISPDYAFGWEGVSGFQRTFEESGGKILQKIWIPYNAKDLSPYIAQISSEADAVFSGLPGAHATMYLKQHRDYGLKAKLPVIGWGVLTDESVLGSMGDEAIGVITAYNYSGALDTPANREFIKKSKAKLGKGPSLFHEATYNAAALINEAAIALKGDFSSSEEILKAIKSAHLKDAPRGPIRWDDYGNPVQNVYIRKVERVGGVLQNTVIDMIPNVSQFWKYEPAEYLKQPPYTRDYPPLKP